VNFVTHINGEMTAEFSGLGDKPGFLDILPISNLIIDGYTKALSIRFIFLMPVCFNDGPKTGNEAIIAGPTCRHTGRAER